MAKLRAPSGLSGLLLIFGVIILVAMLFFSGSSISGFQDMDAECELGLKPCDEGYFCNTGKCTPVFPKPTQQPNAYRQSVDLS